MHCERLGQSFIARMGAEADIPCGRSRKKEGPGELGSSGPPRLVLGTARYGMQRIARPPKLITGAAAQVAVAAPAGPVTAFGSVVEKVMS